MDTQPKRIVIRDGGMFKINTTILPAKCNKPEVINSLYKYILEKYSYTNGKYRLIDINRDLEDLLKREGLI
jgi:hypothetical protein